VFYTRENLPQNDPNPKLYLVMHMDGQHFITLRYGIVKNVLNQYRIMPVIKYQNLLAQKIILEGRYFIMLVSQVRTTFYFTIAKL
jgi:hypothetical protein